MQVVLSNLLPNIIYTLNILKDVIFSNFDYIKKEKTLVALMKKLSIKLIKSQIYA